MRRGTFDHSGAPWDWLLIGDRLSVEDSDGDEITSVWLAKGAGAKMTPNELDHLAAGIINAHDSGYRIGMEVGEAKVAGEFRRLLGL